MVVDFASRRDLTENRLVLLRRWFGSCASARYLRFRVLEDKSDQSIGKYTVVHIALESPLHEEIDFVGDDWKNLFLKKSLRAGLIMKGGTAIECRPIFAIKQEREIELICVAIEGPDRRLSKRADRPESLVMANDEVIFHLVPFTEA